MVCSHSLTGVAPGEAAQSRGDGVGSGSSRRKPSQRSMTPGLSGPLRAEGFPVRDDLLLTVKLPSGGFGQINAKIAGRQARRTQVFYFLTALHSAGLGRSKNPSIRLLLPPAL